jgi:hypothetical protein
MTFQKRRTTIKLVNFPKIELKKEELLNLPKIRTFLPKKYVTLK